METALLERGGGWDGVGSGIYISLTGKNPLYLFSVYKLKYHVIFFIKITKILYIFSLSLVHAVKKYYDRAKLGQFIVLNYYAGRKMTIKAYFNFSDFFMVLDLFECRQD